MTLHVEVLLPDRSLWSGEAGMVIAKTIDGDIGILTGHSPVFGILSPGSVVRVREVPGDDNPGDVVRAAVRDWDYETAAPRTCLLRVRAGAGHGLRRYAEAITADRFPGWDLVTLSYSDTAWWSEHIASFGADVVVLEPTDLRDAVIGRLKGVLA